MTNLPNSHYSMHPHNLHNLFLSSHLITTYHSESLQIHLSPPTTPPKILLLLLPRLPHHGRIPPRRHQIPFAIRRCQFRHFGLSIVELSHFVLFALRGICGILLYFDFVLGGYLLGGGCECSGVYCECGEYCWDWC